MRAYAMCAAAWFPSMQVVSPPLRICEVMVVSADGELHVHDSRQ